MAKLTPVEVTKSYAATVESLADAWEFVMDRVDSVGPDPTIAIKPMWSYTLIDDDNPIESRAFEVLVSGMEEEDE
jgi:hypothetical protein